MHKLLLVFALLVAGCAAPRPAQVSAPTETTAETLLPRVAPLDLPGAFERAVAAGTRTLDGRPGPNYWVNRADYVIEAKLEPGAHRVEATARITYRNNAPQALREVQLVLAQNAHRPGAVRIEPAEVTGGVALQRVAVRGNEVTEAVGNGPGYRVEGTQLIVPLPSALGTGQSVELEIAWGFTVPQAGAGARMGYSRDDLYFIAYWFPQVAVYDDLEGWATDPFVLNAEFYAGHGDYDVTIEVPEDWIVHATGTLENPEEVFTPAVVERMRQAAASDVPVRIVGPDAFDTATRDGALRYRFNAQQVRDFAFSATRRSIWDGTRAEVGDLDGDGEPDYSAIHALWRDRAPKWSEMADYTRHSIASLSEYLAFPYPYPHMTSVEGADIIGGGMEFPMITLMGDYNQRTAQDLYAVTAHEVAHMWIPMIVSNNERRHAWLDEGNTSFNENQVKRDRFPGQNHDAPDAQIYMSIAQAGGEGEIMRWSDYHYTSTAYVIATYQKPATMLVALRGLLGEEAFLSAYRQFYQDWAYKHPTPYDFFHTFEREAGRDLDWFWRAWYLETGVLDQAITGVSTSGNRTTVTVENQGQVSMPVRLVLTMQNGQTQRAEIPVDVWLRGQPSARLTVETPSPVTRVEIDPEGHFPDVDRDDNVWPKGR